MQKMCSITRIRTHVELVICWQNILGLLYPSKNKKKVVSVRTLPVSLLLLNLCQQTRSYQTTGKDSIDLYLHFHITHICPTTIKSFSFHWRTLHFPEPIRQNTWMLDSCNMKLTDREHVTQTLSTVFWLGKFCQIISLASLFQKLNTGFVVSA